MKTLAFLGFENVLKIHLISFLMATGEAGESFITRTYGTNEWVFCGSAPTGSYPVISQIFQFIILPSSMFL